MTHTNQPDTGQTFNSRQEVEDAIERLIDMLDGLDDDPDLEEEPDRESYLAGCLYATGALMDLEADDCDLEIDSDLEPYLAGAASDIEADDADLEPDGDDEDWHQPVNLVSMEGVA